MPGRPEFSSSRIYMGNTGRDPRRSEVEKFFRGFGRLKDISIIPGREYAFVEFEDKRDAEDAIKDLDGRRFGYYDKRVKLEFTRMPPKENRDRAQGRYRIKIKNLTTRYTWRVSRTYIELKNHFKNFFLGCERLVR